MIKSLKSLVSFLSLVLGLGLCVALIVGFDLGREDLAALWAGLNWTWMGVVLILSAALMVSGEMKWFLLHRAFHGDVPLPLEKRRRAYLWHNWIAQFVPPVLALIGGRAYAGRHFSDQGIRKGLVNGLLDQATDFALLCAFLPGAVWSFWFVGGVDGFVLGSLGGLWVSLLGFWIVDRLFPSFTKGLVWPLWALSLVRVSLTGLRLMGGVWAFSLPIEILPVFTLTPLVGFVALLPLTPGNLGLAEWGWSYGLTFMGQSASVAVLYALGFRVLILVAQTVLLALNEVYVRYRPTL